jgi:hypothetical protein
MLLAKAIVALQAAFMLAGGRVPEIYVRSVSGAPC